MSNEPFTFGIPLIARTSARDWPLVEALLDMTLASVMAQTAQDFRIVIAGHERPRLSVPSSALSFIEADWVAEDVHSDNRDSGRKKHAINQHVLAGGGGLLMFLDADDWVDRRLVDVARSAILSDHVGGIIDTGFATDFQSLRTAPIPHPGIFDQGFHTICGSSTVVRLRPDAMDPLRRNPSALLHEHYRWTQVAAEHGVDLARLAVVGNYVINTSENHSEVHGPFADWRRTFTNAVNRFGCPIDDAFLERFGLSKARILEARGGIGD